MTLASMATSLYENTTDLELLIETLTAEECDQLVILLKKRVDDHWFVDANVSLKYADQIIKIGELVNNRDHYALGLMAYGDTLRILGKLEDAWRYLEESANNFQQSENEIGWARTWVGRLGLSIDLHRTEEAFAGAEQGRHILESAQEYDLLLRLDTAIAYVYLLQGKYEQALSVLLPAIDVAENLGNDGHYHLKHLYQNTAYALNHLTQFSEAKAYYQRAIAIFEANEESVGVASGLLNIGHIDEHIGNYNQALLVRLQAVKICEGRHAVVWARAIGAVARGYIQLNRFDDAIDLIHDVLPDVEQMNASTVVAQLVMLLAVAQSELGYFDQAYLHFVRASELYNEQLAQEKLSILQLYQSHLLLMNGNCDEAISLANEAIDYFSDKDQLHYGHALAIKSESLLAKHNFALASDYASQRIDIARTYSLPMLSYQGYLLLGNSYHSLGHIHLAIRRYQAAFATINRVQRGLAMSIRSDFMKDKNKAFEQLMSIFLAQSKVDQAFDTLEAYKAQVFWAYLIRAGQTNWLRTDETQELLDQLEKLRSEHHWFYQKLYPTLAQSPPDVQERETLQQEVAIRETKIRQLTEQLYLLNSQDQIVGSRLPQLQSITNHLQGDVLIEYYLTESEIIIFMATASDIFLHKVDFAKADLQNLIQQVQMNIDTAINVGNSSPLVARLSITLERILQRLYSVLINPIKEIIADFQRIRIVPYSVLHYLPFHLLNDGEKYLGHTHEIVLVPSASYLTLKPKVTGKTVRVLAYSMDKQLPYTLQEGTQICELLEADLFAEEQATREQLAHGAGSILHIAAHGEFRLDYPELSSITLADGQMLTHDLFQYDMHYELVTLSACETGRAMVSANDELLGLGRGFLYNGAGALLVSLWRSDDRITSDFMVNFYGNLVEGKSKSKALQGAWLSTWNQQGNRKLHPAFWGAFQLVGNPQPLTTYQSEGIIRNHGRSI